MQLRSRCPFSLRPLALFAVPFVLACIGVDAPAQTPLGRTDPNTGLFPDSSVADFRFLLDAPAGKHGFVQVDKQGHFSWASGGRARFWGVNISNKSVFTKKDDIDRVVDVLTRAGCNMVRFEAIDSKDGILDAPGSNSSRALDPAKLAILDYWIAKLRERGIYYYLDLLDFREFKPGDDVPAYGQIGRAARPYAFFDRRLIELQKEYARLLLTHRNPLTGLRYVDDPALALVEICNEHGLFFKAANLDDLVEPYKTELGQRWNAWLARNYGSRDTLKAAWGQMADTPVLADSESFGDYTVKLPLLSPAPPAPPAGPDNPRPDAAVVDIRRAPARVRDGVRFLYDTQREYFREMKTALRELGLRVPVAGVVSNEMIPDVASAAADLDFTSENYYADHPAFAGKEWEGTFFYNDTNPLRNSTTYQLAPWLSGLRWDNKPVVVREWADVWPNRYRAIAVPEMAAYASLQDYDAVLLFGYQLFRKPDTLSDFDHQADPPVWGLFAQGAAAFLRGDIAPSPSTVTVQYTSDTLFRWPNQIGSLHRLSWLVRLNSHYREDGAPSLAPGPGEVVVSPSDAANIPAILARMRGVDPHSLERPVLISSTSQIVRRTGEGLLAVSSPRSISLCGELPVNKPVTIGGWTFVSPTSIGAIMVTSLDGRPLASSRDYVVKMVSRAENTAQDLEPAQKGAPARFHLKDWGKAPVLTFGRPATSAVRVLRGGQPIVSLALANGTWEVLVRDRQAVLVCDTPGIRGTVLGRPITTTASQPTTVRISSSEPGAALAR